MAKKLKAWKHLTTMFRNYHSLHWIYDIMYFIWIIHCSFSKGASGRVNLRFNPVNVRLDVRRQKNLIHSNFLSSSKIFWHVPKFLRSGICRINNIFQCSRCDSMKLPLTGIQYNTSNAEMQDYELVWFKKSLACVNMFAWAHECMRVDVCANVRERGEGGYIAAIVKSMRRIRDRA